jgi:inner membrane protein
VSPVTHFLVGWTALERALPEKRDKALVALAGIAPDLDGLGIVVDFATRQLGLPQTDYYQLWHRIYGHGLFPGLVIAAVCAALARERPRVAGFAFIAALLHFACDVLGSRGNGPEDLWGIWPLAPFSLSHEIVWSGQWELISWQNTAITAALLLAIAARALKTGYSPLALVSTRADAQFVATLRKWRGARA